MAEGRVVFLRLPPPQKKNKFLRRLVEPIYPIFVRYLTVVPQFLTYIPSFIQIGSGLGEL